MSSLICCYHRRSLAQRDKLYLALTSLGVFPSTGFYLYFQFTHKKIEWKCKKIEKNIEKKKLYLAEVEKSIDKSKV